ncbi:3'(2'),5'-bisphosphate nucleotidase CysQ [Campylobacter sp. FMV-PI01]|uniref:3'(2'),5'-bisphosphate nucleotidase CysQ n=1 Tax=Campylobacter portucalensis TaxID=2608384 RepID=A0A6L5WHJ8_9BACT|nr:3'(2'),5'-bisphosphate nucleotidase CysQ [Campylobacter portucalensis]MSN95902.1 3'(2'),5'-bisphosphate nucleotidase CysQ [Campylobacter portucalensis]
MDDNLKKELLKIAVLAGKNASKIIKKHYDKFEIYTKKDDSPLTSADLAANEEIFKILEKTGIKICSEESILSDDIKNLDEFWLIDPLDGTKEFIAKNGEFCVCIALIKNSRPILGVIDIPCKDEIFYSSGDGKIYKNDNILQQNTTLNKIFLTGKKSKNKNLQNLATKLNLEISRVGSAIKFCMIAENKALLYSRLGPSCIWDIAAGDFLVSQSGGEVIDLKTKKAPLYHPTNLINNHYLVIGKDFMCKKDEIIKFLDGNS